ncbi:hypothetical protein ACFY9G_23240 [Streptomyces anthocyanicus]|uniref:hypothetical protein n=1 Tax=Streptomyces anthocyanicus TaxID=68174 RepID=UPI0036E759FB
MTYRKRPDLAPHVKEVLGEELRLSREAVQIAETAFKIRIFVAVEQGMTTQEVADALGLSQAAASKYRIQGEALYSERRSGD